MLGYWQGVRVYTAAYLKHFYLVDASPAILGLAISGVFFFAGVILGRPSLVVLGLCSGLLYSYLWRLARRLGSGVGG